MPERLTRLPCEKVHYLHCLKGGAADGDQIPSEHWYESVNVNGVEYVRDGEPEPIGNHNWQALNCTDDYSEAIWMKAPMRTREEQP